jgi:hypothetical protein
MEVQGGPASSRACGETPLRFVILHHTGCDRPHWDWFFEESQALVGWRVYHDPTRQAKDGLVLFRQGDHRKHYLDYEGPLSAGRGQVRRVAAGVYRLTARQPDCWRGVLEGQPVAGPFELRRSESDRWLLTGSMWRPGAEPT